MLHKCVFGFGLICQENPTMDVGFELLCIGKELISISLTNILRKENDYKIFKKPLYQDKSPPHNLTLLFWAGIKVGRSICRQKYFFNGSFMDFGLNLED